jgi:cytochrome c-type biogenesis protein CcmH/NrfG
VDASDAEGEEDLVVIPKSAPSFVRVLVVLVIVALVLGTLFAVHQSHDKAHAAIEAPVVAPAPRAATTSSPAATAAPASPVASDPPVAIAPTPSGASGAVSADAAAAASAAAASASAAAAPVVDGPSPRALVAQAQALLARGSYTHAVEVARRATLADPSNPEGWLTLGGAYGANGNTSQAHSAYRKCIDLAHGSGVGECRALLAP